MGKVIVAKDVKKQYAVGSTVINALNGVDFEIEEGEFAVILGPSGAGKTTLLNVIGGMDNVTSGELLVAGERVDSFNKKQLTDYRRNSVGFVFQFYNLMPNLTALENVELATEMCKDALSPVEVLKSVGLEERMANFPSQLSGGEQQRVSIARAIAKNPRILLCDEPTGALDYATGKTILKLLHDACKQHGKTVIIVTHNSALKEMADKVVYIKNGQAIKTEVIDNPKDVSEIEW
ncbi:MAG: ABC transporter ATP-binding protein [Clostridia bacterium]|nr:ABC transporter ATP-binding protein [Clostridia bacterium]